MKLYSGIDLHSTNSYLAIIDTKGKRIFKEKLPNDMATIVQRLDLYSGSLQGVVVESTYNWYWLVDGLMAEGYAVHLANPSAMQKYKGLKHADDQSDAFWLAEMLRLNILPEGYVYPKEVRPIRDLLRKRSHLVALRSSLLISLQNIITRNCGLKMKTNDIKRLREDRVHPLLAYNEDLALAGRVSKESIDFLTRQIHSIERFVERKLELREDYKTLLTVPGVGQILGLTIMLETGPIQRFEKVGNYASYCRAVSSKWTSNDKTKGKGNKKNGNKYLSWAFSEAAEFARRFDDKARAYYNRKLKKSNFMVAHAALAHKLARAAYYVMRDQVIFVSDKTFT
ncbi:IS110 family RNA-guided transposase [Geomesophilobacter sediminis]|uniref:IS110 family transposase n=1 Tax=Geomesophilobacter sediminis TaxID=2798584 RepID=A0A8J7JE12_9BACT|nr:IS110 family transposase [Geomesophilobacter sediminis]MBJ6725588.1 IS110 family transposase [Geomesophilobacter sediminis]